MWWQNHLKNFQVMRQNENHYSLIDSKTVRFIKKKCVHVNMFSTTCIENKWIFNFSATFFTVLCAPIDT
jgi:hypothetical protein